MLAAIDLVLQPQIAVEVGKIDSSGAAPVNREVRLLAALQRSADGLGLATSEASLSETALGARVAEFADCLLCVAALCVPAVAAGVAACERSVDDGGADDED